MKQNQNGNAVLIVVILLAAAVSMVPITLHFFQKKHNELSSTALRTPAQKPVLPGEVLAGTLADLVEHELSGTSGWRPNDFFLWGPSVTADNNSNRQLGIIQTVRKTATLFKDHLTKISSEEYDPNLVAAENALYNDAGKFWFPSAESRLHDGADALRKYADGLRAPSQKSRPINLRNIELIRVFQAWGDLLGDAHANLFKQQEPDGSSVRPWHNDNYFYHAQGFAHVMYHCTIALKREYAVDLQNRPSIAGLFDQVADALQKAAVLKPLMILDGGDAGLRANHRRNLDAYIVEARQKMYSIREELEK